MLHYGQSTVGTCEQLFKHVIILRCCLPLLSGLDKSIVENGHCMIIFLLAGLLFVGIKMLLLLINIY